MKRKKKLLLLPLWNLTLFSCTPAASSLSRSSLNDVSAWTSSSEDSASAGSSSLPLSSLASGYAPADYHLAWQDEFAGDSLDESHWEAQLGNGIAYGISGWGNGEKECYQKENAIVENGQLNLLAKREDAYEGDALFHYTSARLRSKNKAFFTYGYFEARISLPLVVGMWPAFWLLPESSFQGKSWPVSGELDVMEARGRLGQEVSSTIHYANAAGNDAYHSLNQSVSSIADFHCYGLLWEKGHLAFSVDGVVYHDARSSLWDSGYESYGEGDPFNAPFHLILNLAVGGAFDGGKLPPSDWTASPMQVDYVRVFQK